MVRFYPYYQSAKYKFTDLSQGNTLSIQQNWTRKMKIPTPNSCHNSQTCLPAGLFLYPDGFYSMHSLVEEHYWPATESYCYEDKDSDISTPFSPQEKQNSLYFICFRCSVLILSHPVSRKVTVLELYTELCIYKST